MASSIEDAVYRPVPPRRKRSWLRWTGSFLVGLFALPFLLAAVGAVYNVIATWRDAYCFPPPGGLVNVQGLRLHLDCRGEGRPTVVFEAGMGDPVLAWTLVQPEVAHFSRAWASTFTHNSSPTFWPWPTPACLARPSRPARSCARVESRTAPRPLALQSP
jgi:hypothetical protein